MPGPPFTHTSRVLYVSQRQDRGRSLAQAGLDAENRFLQVSWCAQQDPIAHGSRARQRGGLGLYRELCPGGCRGHAQIRKRRATIYVAEDLEPSRLELLRSHGLDLVIYGKGAWDAEKEARRVAEEEDKIYVSPYNDPIVVGGQGTCGYEISKQLPDLDAALFACGAGGLLTGSAGWLKSHNPEVEAFGVSPENSPVMYESMRANKMVEMETFPTLADTCAGGVDLDSITLPLCQRYVEEILLLTETEIEASIRLLFEQHRLVVEGSGALGVGGLLKHKERFKGKKVVAVVCGRNIDLEVFKRIIQ